MKTDDTSKKENIWLIGMTIWAIFVGGSFALMTINMTIGIICLILSVILLGLVLGAIFGNFKWGLIAAVGFYIYVILGSLAATAVYWLR